MHLLLLQLLIWILFLLIQCMHFHTNQNCSSYFSFPWLLALHCNSSTWLWNQGKCISQVALSKAWGLEWHKQEQEILPAWVWTGVVEEICESRKKKAEAGTAVGAGL